MGIDPAAPDLDAVLGKELANCPHKFASRVHLQQLGPLKRPPCVDARQGIGDLCCALASQRLGLLVPRGNVDYGESILIGPPTNAVVGKKEQVGLVDLIWHPDIKLWSRYAPPRRQVDLPDGLSLEPVLSHIFRGPGSRRQLLDGCYSPPVAPGAIIASHGARVAMYSRSPTNLKDSDAKGSGSCTVVSRRFVGPVKTFAAKRIAARSFDRQSSSEVCAISITARKPGIL